MLTTLIDRWLAARRQSGLRLKNYGLHLRSFAEFAAARDEQFIRANTAIEWASQATTQGQRYRRFHPLAALARYLHAEDSRHELLPASPFRAKSHRPVPYIYSAGEEGRLLKAAAELGPPGSLRPRTTGAVLALLFATGLRISEVLALRGSDVLPDGLMVRKTKFRKSRLVPLHPTAQSGLQCYLKRRRVLKGGGDFLFVAHNGNHLSYSAIRAAWLDVLSQSALSQLHQGVARPRLHDIRHTFAVRALESAPSHREQIAKHMLAVSTYLGHSCIADTYWYFQATPKLMSQVADACRLRFEGRRP